MQDSAADSHKVSHPQRTALRTRGSFFRIEGDVFALEQECQSVHLEPSVVCALFGVFDVTRVLRNPAAELFEGQDKVNDASLLGFKLTLHHTDTRAVPAGFLSIQGRTSLLILSPLLQCQHASEVSFLRIGSP